MPENVYSYLDKARLDPSSQRTLNALPGAITGIKIFKFPESIGNEQTGIPFTIFMPYKRAAAGFYSTQQTPGLFDQLPKPTFAIALPTVPSALKSQYRAEYSQFDIGQGLGAASGTLSNVAYAIRKNEGRAAAAGVLGGVFTGVVDQGKIGLFAGISDLLSKETDNQSGYDLLGVLIGQAKNPYTENAFKNMDFREHTFEYTFMPKSLKDSEEIDRIITIFKYAMMPQPGTLFGQQETGFFDFPFEFQITHSIQDTTFTLLPSVLQSLEIDFGGGTDSLKLFRPDGKGRQFPAKITLSMVFKEMVLLTRDRIIVEDEYKFAGDPTSDAKRYRF